MSKRKEYTEMNADELAEATAEFDKEFAAESFGDLDPKAKHRWANAKRKRGRPIRGEGAVRVSVTIEKSLLRQADRFVEKTGQTRSQLIERGLRKVLGGSRR